MQLAGLTIVLRPRSAWEAIDLGIALVRSHASRIWTVWILLTLPVAIVFGAIGILSGELWIGAVLLWWFKPLFDRIPLFVLSRALFGAPPTVRETLRAQWRWRLRGIWPWLFWRRFHPSRAMLLPVDLLENLRGPARGARSRVLLRAVGSPSMLLTLICMNIEIMLSISIVVLGLMFVPIEFFSESTRAIWSNLMTQPPLWAQCLSIFISWLAMSLIEPFYVGAGFGLYLNRRTQLEAWDIELAFRRIAGRLAQTLSLLVFVLSLTLAGTISARAAPLDEIDGDHTSQTDGVCVIDADEAAKQIPDEIAGAAAQAGIKAPLKPNLKDVFGSEYRDDDAAFKAAIIDAYKDPDLNPKTTIDTWKHRHPSKDEVTDKTPSPWLHAIGRIIAALVQSGLWILLAIVLLLVIRYHRRWLPWISDRFEPKRAPERLTEHDIAMPESLPDDIAAAVRKLWQQGQSRAALALLYRGAVHRLALDLGTVLPPGATESQCLRYAWRLPNQVYAKLFLRIVHCWQAAAYAQRMPSGAEVEMLLREWNQPSSAVA
jgi:hypothetical protein